MTRVMSKEDLITTINSMPDDLIFCFSQDMYGELKALSKKNIKVIPFSFAGKIFESPGLKPVLDSFHFAILAVEPKYLTEQVKKEFNDHYKK